MNKRCCNCAFRGEVFNLGYAKHNHTHCSHPKWEEEPCKTKWETGELSGWDTLKQVLETCEDWQPKQLNS